MSQVTFVEHSCPQVVFDKVYGTKLMTYLLMCQDAECVLQPKKKQSSAFVTVNNELQL